MRLIASRVQVFFDHACDLLEKLDLPPWQEYKKAASVAFHDVRVATASSFKFGHLTFRPVFILLGIILQCLAVVLQIILENSIYHGWRAAKEFYFQLQLATMWFIRYQKSLSPSAIYAEVAAMAAIATLWLLRRHVRKHRYYERTMAWYEIRKLKLLKRYNHFVDQVGKTSTFLALMLPHLLYFTFAAIIKRLLPWLVTYLATKTPINAFIQYFHPLYCTFLIIGKYTQHLRTYTVAEAGDDDSKSSSKMTPSNVKRQQKQKAELEELRKATSDILKYWVVYAIIVATVRTGKLLPFVGHVFTVAGDNVAKGKRRQALLSKLRFSSKFVEEISLVFFTWLRFMPSSVTRQEKSSLKGRGISPIDIIYKKFSLFVKSAMSSSASLTNRAAGNGWLSWLVGKLDSLLSILVLGRAISQKTKQKVISTAAELSDLIPAAVTLFVPGCSSYGVIYVSLVVPAAYSIKSCEEIGKKSSNLETMESKVNDASRFLRFWMIHALVTWILDSFAPILAWVPFSSHLIWLLWAFLQLEASTRRIYGWFESEVEKPFDQTQTLQTVKKVIAALPSNVDVQKDTSSDAAQAEKSKKED
eukprot:CAMPEP_0201731380 /NCGR_PEP_ID=MMETSP0593-20130828/25504_1 /ASSEMBLY_ACC=CAM_ASM_000672 /TAXON_ID=267983 /ORGANISM="Skeletonema japonicum, Strain CCMP2506" /LENGTH=586 /DNA_ID=CAMNT_0048224137 /DNA_START=72 /DNA_END=1832 /DNA_ORIENTATION=+